MIQFPTIAAYLRLLLVTLLAEETLAQQMPRSDQTSSFKVIEAIAASKGDGKSINRFDTLNASDQVTLEKGFLLITNETGNILEFAGDTTFKVSRLNTVFKADSTLFVDIRPGYLFQSKNHYRLTGAVSHAFPAIELLFPASHRYDEDIDGKHCLWWKYAWADAPVTQEYLIEVKNIWDEPLDSLIVNGNRLEINLNDFKNTEKDELGNLFVFKIRVRGKPDQRSEDLGFRNTVGGFSPISPCNAQKSVEFLQLAIYFEIEDFLEEALHYYKLAAENSAQPVYTEILEYFAQRKQAREE